MRSTNFVILSIALHGLCVFALMNPVRTVSEDTVGNTKNIEVKMGEADTNAGVATAQEQTKEVEQAAPAQKVPEPQVAEPVQQEKPKAVKVATIPKAKPTPKPTKSTATPVVASAPSQVKADDKSDDLALEKEEQTSSDPKPTFIPVKETAPAGVEAQSDSDTEAKSEDVQKTDDPSPVGVTESPSTGNAPVVPAAAASTGAAAATTSKGGAAKESAVSYLDLKQLPGNKSPTYPMQARLDKRQGNLELLYRVTKDGKVSDIQVSKSSGQKDLDQEAVRAIAQFRFVPGQEGWARHPVNFSLKGPVAELPSHLRAKGAQND